MYPLRLSRFGMNGMKNLLNDLKTKESELIEYGKIRVGISKTVSNYN